jgi:transposase
MSREQAERREASTQSREERGNWLKPALVEASRSAGRSKTYLGAQYQRLARRIGASRAATAVAHSIIVILHHVIRTGQGFMDMGQHYFEQRNRAAIARQLMRRLERLGLKIAVQAS